jgi:hypothetical protein
MSDINAEVTEWVVNFWKQAEPVASEIEADEADIEKGGRGSGEHQGHPFRGNRYTSGVQSANHHEVRPGTEHYGHAQHLTAASAHIAAGRAAMAHGEFGIAHSHFNEAAYHASQASSQIVHGAGNREMGHHAELLYHAAHHAGDAAEKASYLTNQHQDAIRSGRGTTVVTREQLLDTSAGQAVPSTNNVGNIASYSPLIPGASASDRILTTEELGNAAAGARANAEAQSNILAAADNAVNSARGLYAPATIGSSTGRSYGSGQIASGQ